ncbi:hypothetical protein LJC33_00445 [Eubacteriales bacterium OttesenSCG-928-N13]|nr:hypothetical protein [Eubacteriales bacterium OttesenSCG-928-N13]
MNKEVIILAQAKCPKCGAEFTHSQRDCIVTLNKSGYDVLKTDDRVAEELFQQALSIDPTDFAASIGMVFAHLARIERAQNDRQTAIGVYLLTRSDADAQWHLTAENHMEAEKYIEYLDDALESAPEQMRHKLELYRQYNVEDAWIQIHRMIEEN